MQNKSVIGLTILFSNKLTVSVLLFVSGCEVGGGEAGIVSKESGASREGEAQICILYITKQKLQHIRT